MRLSCRLICALAVSLGSIATARAQTILLAESPREGDCFRITAETTLTGSLKVTRDGKHASVKVTAKNDHQFLERVLVVQKGLVRKTARHYVNAVSRATLDNAKMERTLSADRRFIVAQRTGDSLFTYSPAGPLTQVEREVTSEHFETLHLAALLPGKEVKIGDSWKLDSEITQSLCLFDGLISHSLTATLKQADSAMAIIAINGTAKGLENGAMANLTVAATVWFDRGKKRIVAVNWKQKDVRDQGPVSPAAELESTTIVKREPLEQQPNELNTTVLASVPTTNDPPATMQNLIYRDPRSRFQLLYPRDWHLVGQTDFHLIMRLLDRGDFVAQATLTCWKNAGAAKHMAPSEFEKTVAEGTGWKMEQVLERVEIPTDGGRWVYRVAARGELDGIKVIQNFYLVAAPERGSNDRDVHDEAERRRTHRHSRPGDRERHRFSQEVGLSRGIGLTNRLLLHGDAFCQVARLVDVAVAKDGNVICE